MKKKNLDFTIFNQEVMKKKKKLQKGVYDILLLVDLPESIN